MEAVVIPGDWSVDQILDDLDQHGFSIIDHAYPINYLKNVVTECQNHLNDFRNAAIQNGVVSTIRSDHILWLNPKLSISHQHIQTLQSLSQILNREFYLGIQEVEAHFACYNPGDFYALHRDNPQDKNGRVISTVFYLHEQWQENWGGQLRLQDKNNQWHIIEPKSNRIALFQSDLLHEVLVTQHQRLSITAWLRTERTLI
ncbi:2OG-Fe(II) oxygenase [Acinetobacter sp. YH12239]|uniref:2OG-Fe(II) oxygenase n=1 Tax=Acinetobacter sp. YH12239 TaxID=2601166 RepID=UPI0015D2965E|nr:2OG-Fe(II) oxygenase [Acinetobacter sp. YH12239]